MASVTFENVTRMYGAKDGTTTVKRSARGKKNAGELRPAVDSLNLEIQDGEFLVLVGPSGCGKSTSLRMLAGLEPTNGGRILIGGNDATGVAPRDRDVAMVFQNYALYPNMTVAGNMGFALRNRGMSKAETEKKVREGAEILELTELLDRKPAQLSGGQRQRVAMGRAIVRDPAVFCMDEPLSNLDAKLRVSTRSQISSLQKRLGTTTVYVTHDQVEAMTMGDRVAVMKDGVLQQAASPREVYDRPANTFVATFIGSPTMALLTCPAKGRTAWVGSATVESPVDVESSKVVVGVRAEDWEIGGYENESSAGASISGCDGVDVIVDYVEELGAESFLYCRPADPAVEVEGSIAVRAPRGEHIEVNTRICVKPTLVHLFDVETGERIN